ncbi:MAG: hypothetical protein B6U72_00010 [Candidatus Altiarchaeales archaeon ex4484_2]|nr:MAG: hypothetical protein B6U72_00010 [Candidatus Altiarchaeales archaeon ex4484_2]
MMESAAFSYSTVEIANSFKGKSAVFALDYLSNAVVKLTGNKKITFRDSSFSRFRDVVKNTLDYFGRDYGCRVHVETGIPQGVGLGFDEAVSSSIMLSLCGALSRADGAIYELRIDKYVREQVFEIDGSFVNFLDLLRDVSSGDLRFDRFFSSLYGGFIVADNSRKTVLRRGEMESLYAAVLLPGDSRRGGVDTDFFLNEAQVVFDEALKGNLYSAMKLYGLFFFSNGLEDVLSRGALTATANKEGTVVALCRQRETAEKISDLVYETANKKAMVDGKPLRIIKVNEFLRLKGDMDFYWV